MARSNLSLDSVVVRAEGQLSADLGDECVILDSTKGFYYGLERHGVLVWHLIQQPRRIVELRDAILDEFEVESARCERDLMELLSELQGEGLIKLRRHTTA